MANRMNLRWSASSAFSCAYPTASDRFHTFVLEGVPEMQARLHSWAPDTSSNCAPQVHLGRFGCAPSSGAAASRG